LGLKWLLLTEYYDIVIAVEDVDGIHLKNLLFFNNEESLPHEFFTD
jgi:hypothetical protein